MKSSTKTLLAALGLTIAAPLIAYGLDAPRAVSKVAPVLPSELSKLEGKVSLEAEINSAGFITSIRTISNSDIRLAELAEKAFEKWKFKPATSDGVAIASKVRQEFYFNQSVISLDESRVRPDRNPSVITTVSPKVPEELARITGRVTLVTTVAENGKPESIHTQGSTHKELESLAIEALQKWRFKSAIKGGEKVASTIAIPFHFKGKGIQEVAKKSIPTPDRAPRLLKSVNPDLPHFWETKSANAQLSLLIDEKGYVLSSEALEGSDPILANAAQKAVLQWRFKPAVKNGKRVATKAIQSFSYGSNKVLVAEKKKLDRIPRVSRYVEPQLPKDMKGTIGVVKVQLRIDDKGKIIGATATESTHSELEKPVLEAVNMWKFKPAIKQGEAVSSTVVVPVAFGS